MTSQATASQIATARWRSYRRRRVRRELLVRGAWVAAFVIAWYFQRLWLLLFVFGGSFVYIVLNQDRILYGKIARQQRRYVENPENQRSPTEWTVPFESVRLKTEDGITIIAWLLTQPDFDLQRKVPTILCMHGNSGNMGRGLAQYASMFHNLGVNLLLLEYRGYGESEGEPSEEGLILDAKAALSFLYSNPTIDREQIFVFGQSLGGAVAASVAASTGDDDAYAARIRGVVLENTFLSISAMAERVFLPLRLVPDKFMRPFLRSQWRTCDAVARIRAPILFLSGLHDHMVGPEQMKELYRIAKKRRWKRLQKNKSEGDYGRVERKNKGETVSMTNDSVDERAESDEKGSADTDIPQREWFVTFEAKHSDLYLRETAKYFTTIQKFLNCVTRPSFSAAGSQL
mmetsp:Transcript_9326/g.14940  ORF Transcript_9326/g.14940 Transcript_9326/m.14940 type:complete len:402 (+) Transcript_9326:116-1321(+)